MCGFADEASLLLVDDLLELLLLSRFSSVAVVGLLLVLDNINIGIVWQFRRGAAVFGLLVLHHFRSLLMGNLIFLALVLVLALLCCSLRLRLRLRVLLVLQGSKLCRVLRAGVWVGKLIVGVLLPVGVVGKCLFWVNAIDEDFAPDEVLIFVPQFELGLQGLINGPPAVNLDRNRERHEHQEKIPEREQSALVVSGADGQPGQPPPTPSGHGPLNEIPALVVLLEVCSGSMDLSSSNLILRKQGRRHLPSEAHVHECQEQQALGPELEENVERGLGTGVLDVVVGRLAIVNGCLVVAEDGFIPDVVCLLRAEHLYNPLINRRVASSNPVGVRGEARKTWADQRGLEGCEATEQYEPAESRAPEAARVRDHAGPSCFDFGDVHISPRLLASLIIDFERRRRARSLCGSGRHLLYVYQYLL